MKRRTLITVLCFAACQLLAAQSLTLKEITSGAFRPETMAGVKPLAGGDSYAQISADRQQIVSYSFRNGEKNGVLFDAATARGPKIDRIDGYIISPTGKRILIQTDTKAIYRRSFTATYYIYEVVNNKLVPLSEGGPQQTPVWSPDGEQVAFVRDNNIFLVKLLYNNAESQVTKDGEDGKVKNGIPDWVYEEEFSFNSAMVFSADSRQIVWVRFDESEVKEYSLQTFKGLAPEREEYKTYPGFYTYKYPKAGEKAAKVQVMSYDIKSHKARQVAIPMDYDGYIPRIFPTNDSSKVAVLTLNRHQDDLKIFMVNPLSTLSKLLIEDKVDKYISEDALSRVLFTDSHILMLSERSGFSSIYIYAINGQLQRTVKNGIITDIYGYDEQTGDVYYAALPDGPLNKKVYVEHKNGKTDCLTPQDGWNSAIFSADHKAFLATWSNIDTPPVTTLCAVGGKTKKTMTDNTALAQKYGSYGMGRKELFTFTTSEGVKLYGWLVKPAGFNPAKRYPVVMYQYGGPGNQQVKNEWNLGMNGQGAIIEQYLAQQGYLVACVDGRGTGGRGAEFEKCTYLRLGELEARDQVEAAIWLGQQPYVDKDRIGIWGWSYGGWNTLMAMSEGREVFAAGVAIAPPTCWRYYDNIYTERFMRTPEENADGYDTVNPIARVERLHGSLLLCHGLADDNVHYQNTAEYVEALVQADKDFRQLVYTNRNHSIYGGNTRNHLFRQCVNFFNQELKR